MIECVKCGAEYPTERLFCGKCRTPLGIRCHVCGFINLLDDLFCGICQTDLKTQTFVSAERHIQQSHSSPDGLYQELLTGVDEDKNMDGSNNKLAQEEIDNIFLKDDE
jgi:hypothetical protein